MRSPPPKSHKRTQVPPISQVTRKTDLVEVHPLPWKVVHQSAAGSQVFDHLHHLCLKSRKGSLPTQPKEKHGKNSGLPKW